MKNIGFIGLGAMGSAMARNIHKGGYPLGVYNRNPVRSQPFMEEGHTVYSSPADSDYLFFVADGSGRHRFSRTNAEHNRARQEIRRNKAANGS